MLNTLQNNYQIYSQFWELFTLFKRSPFAQMRMHLWKYNRKLTKEDKDELLQEINEKIRDSNKQYYISELERFDNLYDMFENYKRLSNIRHLFDVYRIEIS